MVGETGPMNRLGERQVESNESRQSSILLEVEGGGTPAYPVSPVSMSV